MTLVDILGWLLIGLIVGAVARLILPGSDPMGCLATSLVGIAGAFVGGFLTNMLYKTTGDYIRPGFIVAVVGSVLVLWLFRSVRRGY